MRINNFGGLTSWLLLALISWTYALPQITRTGKYLYDPSGNRFFIKVSLSNFYLTCKNVWCRTFSMEDRGIIEIDGNQY